MTVSAQSQVAVSTLRDPAQAPSGQQKIAWVAGRMPIVNAIRQEFEQSRPLAGRRIAICIHLEAKTAYMAMALTAAGAQVTACASNPLSTQDDVCAALAENGVAVHAWHGASAQEYAQHLERCLAARPELLIDDGGDLVTMLHTSRQDLAVQVLGGTEETTTGIQRLKAMAAQGVLRFPMVAVNNAQMKHLFDNRYGTGQSVWDSIMRNTNVCIAGKAVVVAGYGWCGKGVAARARGLGARVIVCEVNPVSANEALMDGFAVLPMAEAAREGDIFVTVTGCEEVIRQEHLEQMKDGTLLANAGHFDCEISKPGLRALAMARHPARPNVEEYHLKNGRRLYLLGDGRLVNLAAGDGHPIEVMDMSFGVQALTLAWLNSNAGQLPPAVVPVGADIDRQVAELRLRSLGVHIDRLTSAQERYLESWQV